MMILKIMPKCYKRFELRSRIRLTYVFAAFMAFFVGIAIYVFFRNHKILLFQIFPKPAVLDLFYYPVRVDSVLMSLFLFNLPDGLWFLSGLLLIRAVWLVHPKWRVIYACSFGLIALAMEILQVFANVPGTFDWLDIVFMALFSYTESAFFIIAIKRKVL